MPPIPADTVADLPAVARRFVRYVQIDTQSDPDSASVPSTEKQLVLSRLLLSELRGLGVEATVDEAGYVYATLPSTLPPGHTVPVLGLVAHVDTSPDEPGGGVRPLLHRNYQGEVIALPGDPSVTLDPARQSALRAHLGHDLITSDGTTLLGSDDKAGVAVLMQLAEDLAGSTAPRPEVRLLFTVDEEIGRGVDHLDRARFGADVAYTIDGGPVGELSSETFNAAEATVTVEGVTVHPGYAKGVMANAVRVLAEFIAALPANETPSMTEERQGYFYPYAVTQGETGRASVRILLRDFEDDGLARRKTFLRSLAEELGERHPRAHISVEVRDSYRNMLRYIEETDPRTVSFADAAARAVGLTPRWHLVRGGTDGARLSEIGIPTPNVFTGGYDFHSRFEWNTVQNLNTTLSYVNALVEHWGQHGGT
ncbi:MAG: peptidase T [Bacteroidota bacterium]